MRLSPPSPTNLEGPVSKSSNQITAQEKDIVVLMRSKWAWGGFGSLGFHLIRKEKSRWRV